MDNFDALCEEYASNSRTISRTERKPKINLSRDFLEALEREYFECKQEGNRNFHTNFLKRVSFAMDDFKGNPELEQKYAQDGGDIGAELEADLNGEEFPVEEV